MDTQQYLDYKSKVVFEFLTLRESKPFTLETIMLYPKQLRLSGEEKKAELLSQVYEDYFKRLLAAAGKHHSELEISKSDFIKANVILRKSSWYLSGFLEPITDVYFDGVDRDGNGVISLSEWRQLYKLRGIEDEKFITSTFQKMDSNGDGQIDRKEFKHAFIQYGIGTDQSEDYSFIYDINTS